MCVCLSDFPHHKSSKSAWTDARDSLPRRSAVEFLSRLTFATIHSEPPELMRLSRTVGCAGKAELMQNSDRE